MKKLTTFMLLAAALLVSVPSWARLYPDGTEKDFDELGMPLIVPDLSGAHFGTICVPQRIVATQGIVIYDVTCVDMFYRGGNSDTTEVARLVVDAHTVCDGGTQMINEPWSGRYYDSEAEPFCPATQQTSTNPCGEKTYIDWSWDYVYYDPDTFIRHDFRMVAGAAYFYNVCDGVESGTAAKTLADRKIWVDNSDVATAPVCQNGFYGTFEKTTIDFPVTVLTQDGEGTQYLEQVTKVTIPANRGYFLGNFECVPWRWNTHDNEPEPYYDPAGNNNPIHYPCSPAPVVPRKVSSNAVAFNVGPRDAATGLYPIDLEHPIYLGKETNKRIANGQLIIEAADGSIYNAFGLKLR